VYQSFEVSNFRCFSKLTMTNLERVNLIAGMNNVGKIALLEALFLHCGGGYNPALVMRINTFRGIEAVRIELGQWAEAPWDSLFREFEAAKKVELVGENTESGRRVVRLKVLRQPEELAAISQFVQQYGLEKAEATSASAEISQSEVAKVLELEYEEVERTGKYYLLLDLKGARTMPMPPGPPFPASFQGSRMRLPFREEAERFGKLQVQGKEEVLSEVLRLIEPRLSRLTMVVVAGEPMLHGDVGVKRLIPLPPVLSMSATAESTLPPQHIQSKGSRLPGFKSRGRKTVG
jgi:hypothetical protein